MEAVVTALTTGISSMATEGMTAITSIIPVAFPIIGSMIVVGLGMKIFHKVTGV